MSGENKYTYYIVKMDNPGWFITHWLIFRFFGGSVRRGNQTQQRPRVKRERTIPWGLGTTVGTTGLEDTEKGVWWRWVSTKIWGFRGSFGIEIKHRKKRNSPVGCLQVMGLQDTIWLFAGDRSSGYGGRSVEKEKEKKKAQTFLLGLACVCLWR